MLAKEQGKQLRSTISIYMQRRRAAADRQACDPEAGKSSQQRPTQDAEHLKASIGCTHSVT